MCQPSPNQVLSLYRSLLRYRKQLKYTDKNYFSKRIRKEFERNRTLAPEESVFQYERGLVFLQNKRVI
ncbi:mitochondrial ribosome and complex I assembly factor AltMIEF1 isoform X1 [Hetaerina americana]|uniref:mitochondrial ribosome and complex I assembly factor AltMIEF1 isoform X1 n=1 Tax=Hetaerina americana TaxID=62018 RepID=UPI003A7F41ED